MYEPFVRSFYQFQHEEKLPNKMLPHLGYLFVAVYVGRLAGKLAAKTTDRSVGVYMCVCWGQFGFFQANMLPVGLSCHCVSLQIITF
jgi:hypothetical protein